jgi:hypothetical protein
VDIENVAQYSARDCTGIMSKPAAVRSNEIKHIPVVLVAPPMSRKKFRSPVKTARSSELDVAKSPTRTREFL